jgi:uncharacterized protein (TIGR02996 family)
VKSDLPKDMTTVVLVKPFLLFLRQTPPGSRLILSHNVISGGNDEHKGRLTVTVPPHQGHPRMFASFATETSVRLPLYQIEEPGAGLFDVWKPLPVDFEDALKLVMTCATDRCGIFSRALIHLTPTYIEAYDGQQMSRYHLDMPVGDSEKGILVRRVAAKHMRRRRPIYITTPLGKDTPREILADWLEEHGFEDEAKFQRLPLVTEFSETPEWFHVRNGDDIRMSMRQFHDEYIKLDEIYNRTHGDVLVLPELTKTIAVLRVASSEPSDSERIYVTLASGATGRGRMILQEKGNTHQSLVELEVGYTGATREFCIDQNLLTACSGRQVEIDEMCITIRGTHWKRLLGLRQPESP